MDGNNWTNQQNTSHAAIRCPPGVRRVEKKHGNPIMKPVWNMTQSMVYAILKGWNGHTLPWPNTAAAGFHLCGGVFRSDFFWYFVCFVCSRWILYQIYPSKTIVQFGTGSYFNSRSRNDGKRSRTVQHLGANSRQNNATKTNIYSM